MCVSAGAPPVVCDARVHRGRGEAEPDAEDDGQLQRAAAADGAVPGPLRPEAQQRQVPGSGRTLDYAAITCSIFSLCIDHTCTCVIITQYYKYVVKHKSAKLIMMYAAGKLEAALNLSH